MTEERDPFREYVEQEVGNKKWKCKLCGGKFAGRKSRILPHLAGIPCQNIRPCEKVDHEVKEEASRVFYRKRKTSGAGTEGTVSGASQSVAPSEGASNPNDVQNSNRPGCALQQPSFDPPTVTGTAPACPQDQEPLRSSMPQDLIDLFASPSLDISALLEFPEQSSHGVIMPDAPLYSDQSNLDDLLSENFGESLAKFFEEIEADELHNPAVVSSLQIDPSLDVDGANRLQDCGQPRGVEVVPDPSNRSPTDIVQHPGQLPPRCDEEDGNDIRRFPSQTPMVIDPSTALQHPSDSHFFDSHLRVPGASTNPIGPSSSRALVPPQRQIVPHRSINLQTVHQNPTMPSSSWENRLVTGHPQALMDMDPCMPSSSQAPNNAPPPPQILPCGTGLIGPSSLPESYMNEGVPMMSHPKTGNNFEDIRNLKRKLELLYEKEASIRVELEFAASLYLKKLRMGVADWLAEMEKLRNDCPEAASEDCLPPHQRVDTLMREAEDYMRQHEGLFEARETKVKLLEDKMVGEAFWRNTTKILEYLVGNQISRLGIYGMGGVGKTTIMVHIYNRLLEKENYGNVMWITVSQDFNTQRLQDAIGKELGLGILQEKDVRKRAAMLCDYLMKRGKSTIILDDVWEHFVLRDVGIPVGADGIKLVLTTRSFDVCRLMQCQEMIKIEPLSQIEAEGLFLEELTSEVALNLETKAVVKSIVKECAGLPLAIITMARSMQGVTDVLEWKDSLEKLRESDMGQTDMEKKVLMKLKLSYDRLDNNEVQQCFLSCALYPEDKLIDKFELIEFFIDQELISRLNMREKQHVRGSTILNKLVNVCLLEDHGRKIKMHDLIRDMALHIMSEILIVEAGKGLRRIPYEEYWTKDLEKVPLMENEIKEFPLNMSPNCPKLSTFLFNKSSSCDVVIPDSFYRGLKVLNLSGCNLRELPDSISDLVHLTALLIRKCRELRCIPYLGKLRSLRKLDAVCCVELEEIKGLEKLVNLTYLDIAHTRIKRLPKGTLGATLKLQYLSVQEVSEEDIIKLSLETLKCQFEDVDDFNKLVRVVSKQENNPRYYMLNMCRQPPPTHMDLNELAHLEHCERSVHIGMRSHAVVSAGGESSGVSICILIPQDVRVLIVSDCNGTINLRGMGPLKNLEKLVIIAWKNLGVLCRGQDEEIIDIHDFPALTPAPLLFQRLRDLIIVSCWKMKYLFRHGPKFSLPCLQKIAIIMCDEMVGITVATSPPPHLPRAFPSLEKIEVRDCRKMKRVVESEWLPHFPKLKIIEAVRLNIEEIIGVPPPYMPVAEISLEQLRVSCCHNMRKLFSHEWMLHLRNLQTIDVHLCSEMVEMISGVGQAQEGSMMTPVNNTPSSSSQSSISLPELKHLELCQLPHLKSICEVPITCDSMEYLRVLDCPELNKIPLQLRLRDIGDLPYIEVESEEKWKTLIWDHPDAQAILQPHLLFLDSLCVLEGRGRCISCELSI